MRARWPGSPTPPDRCSRWSTSSTTRRRSALEAAARLGVAVPVEVWGDDGAALDADAHEARLRALVRDGGQAAIATDPRQLDEMLAVAGPIVAWTR